MTTNEKDSLDRAYTFGYRQALLDWSKKVIRADDVNDVAFAMLEREKELETEPLTLEPHLI